MSSVLARKVFLKRIGHVFVFSIVLLLGRLFGGFLFRFLRMERFAQLNLKKIKNDFYSGNEFFVEKSGPNIRVLSRKCPHLGCTVQRAEGEQKIICPCHGSTFTLQGKYINGPANKDLQALSYQKIMPDSIKIRLP